MSARFVDALKGYEYYIANRGKPSMRDVNRFLKSIDRKPIRPRTFVHYGKLLDKGFRSYIPINKFDVFEALGRVQLASDRRRYSREVANFAAQVSRDASEWVDATILDRSLVGFGISVHNSLGVPAGSLLWVRIRGYEDIPCFVIWRIHQGRSTKLGARAIQFVGNFLQVQEEFDAQRLCGVLIMRRSHGPSLELREFLRLFEQANALLEAATALVYSLDDLLGAATRIARPVVTSVKFGSPGEGQVKVDLGIAEIVKVVVDFLHVGALNKKKLREETRRLELENANLEIETIRNAINLHKDASQAGIPDQLTPLLLEPIRKALNVKELPLGVLAEGTPERAIVAERLLPAAADLVAGDDPGVEIEIRQSD